MSTICYLACDKMDRDLLSLCRITPLFILLDRPQDHPKKLPYYIEQVIAEGSIPSHSLVAVQNYPRFREAAIRGCEKLWDSFNFKDEGGAMSIDIRKTNDLDSSEKKSILASLLRDEPLVYQGVPLIMSIRASNVVNDLSWLMERDECRIGDSDPCLIHDIRFSIREDLSPRLEAGPADERCRSGFD